MVQSCVSVVREYTFIDFCWGRKSLRGATPSQRHDGERVVSRRVLVRSAVTFLLLSIAHCLFATAQTHAEVTVAMTSKGQFPSEAQPETFAHSRSEAANQAAQVPGAAFVLLEALQWRGKTAHQLGLPSSLWCADFMNFVFARFGSQGTKSRSARSYLTYGVLLDSPRVGAIAIFARGGRNSGHVGIVRGTDGEGNPIVVSGNHGNTVREATYPKGRVLGYVMPPEYVLQEMARHARQLAVNGARL